MIKKFLSELFYLLNSRLAESYAFSRRADTHALFVLPSARSVLILYIVNDSAPMPDKPVLIILAVNIPHGNAVIFNSPRCKPAVGN